ncbi:TPA: type II toxin-antitoxin system HigB family toxin [Salmonella enterica subsp. enterica serovar Muenchen]|uniref:Addiction module toxin RelE n=1 Tax=Salmonella enterica I TaxID=59201 RepID=A0A403MPJ1_SALET|nr:type II toxin-antitoxin system HigB family toxin [Salmonella sp. SG203]EBW6041108.1 addiction module toxin RelE [Salmonella enterica subsp. enterica serovar Oranienburg]EDV3838640.1 addiction module toxin RelE [Salmonella enterica subsp. diarizonae]EIG0952174.1 type II toxin-antitoxin system HigB family toxin [Salmonella enterica subsp. enterica serovar Muenchen]HAF5680681.1 addiction module toxin RelE [Salmonella enterica]EED9398241.1 addiction module toxin RelE [Salmonella enterica subsp.
MHLISMKAIHEAVRRHPQYRKELLQFGRNIEKGNCPSPDALKKIYPSLDNFKYLDKHYVIDIANNHLRIIVIIFFESQKFYVRHVFNHSEYDRFTSQHRTKGKR